MKKIAALSLSLILILSFCIAFAGEWKCPNCGKANTGNFCTECGTQSTMWICPSCGKENYRAFCENCGTAKPTGTSSPVPDERPNDSDDSQSAGSPSAEIPAADNPYVRDEPTDPEETPDQETTDIEKDDRLPYKEEIRKWAAEYSLDPALVASVIRNESSFQPQAESAAGARGLMQLTSATADYIAAMLRINNYSFEDLYDPETSIRFGCWYLAYLSRHFNGDIVSIVAAYCIGEAQVIEWLVNPFISEDGKTISPQKLPEGPVKNYIQNIIRDMEVYQNSFI